MKAAVCAEPFAWQIARKLEVLRATIVLSNTSWITGALLPEIRFVDSLVNNSSCDACSSSYSGFSSLWGCKSVSTLYQCEDSLHLHAPLSGLIPKPLFSVFHARFPTGITLL